MNLDAVPRDDGSRSRSFTYSQPVEGETVQGFSATDPYGQQLVAIGNLGDATKSGSRKRRVTAAILLLLFAIPTIWVVVDLVLSLLHDVIGQ